MSAVGKWWWRHCTRDGRHYWRYRWADSPRWQPLNGWTDDEIDLFALDTTDEFHERWRS